MKIPKEIVDKYFKGLKSYPPMDPGSDEWWDIKTDFELKDDAFAGVLYCEDYNKPLETYKIKKIKSNLEEFKKRLDDYKPKDSLEAKEKKLLHPEEIVKVLTGKVAGISDNQARNFLSVLEKIAANNFGKLGLIVWPEISPKGTRERIYIVLKEKNKPLHFSEIAKFIDEYNLSKRKSHPQTVHNELIKDERFVLIGRGIYALKEWGYESGTVKDILERILKENKEPLAKEEILSRILKSRKVKKSTVMINLNNHNFFIKQGNTYSIKK